MTRIQRIFADYLSPLPMIEYLALSSYHTVVPMGLWLNILALFSYHTVVPTGLLLPCFATILSSQTIELRSSDSMVENVNREKLKSPTIKLRSSDSMVAP